MLNSIQDAVMQLLPFKRKKSPSGWVSFNAPCCVHNGESHDKRGRGGLMPNANGGVSYHCFNCQFKAHYTPGYHLNYKFRKLLTWFGADENTVRRLVIDAIRVKDLFAPETLEKEPKQEIQFKPRSLPDDAVNILESKDVPALEYLLSRRVDPEAYPFYTSPGVEHNLNRRVIVPCYWKNEIVGYTARAWDSTVSPKYHNHYDSNYVFNVDRQQPDWKFVLVVEGPFDAMAVDGVAILTNECNETKADIIDSLGREVIVVPDFDIRYDEKTRKNKWSGQMLIDQAVEYGWTVSFPVWAETCKDVAEAVTRYGKLFVLKSILDARETSRLKIELRKRKLAN
jgi:hypothetical protein